MKAKSGLVLFFTALLISIEGISVIKDFSPLTLQPDYFWRDYTGDIPKDAIVGGATGSGGATYIGQALGYGSDNYGNIPTEITPGSKALIVPLKGAIQSDLDMRVLCSSSRGFKWIQTTAQSFQNDIWNLRVVKGGSEVNISENNKKTLFVGRIRLNGQIVVGKIVINANEYQRGYSPFFAVLNGGETGPHENFEVLVFDP